MDSLTLQGFPWAKELEGTTPFSIEATPKRGLAPIAPESFLDMRFKEITTGKGVAPTS